MYSRNRRPCRIRSCAASRSTPAFTRKDSSRTSANDERAANFNNRSSAPGAIAAADEIASTFAPDSAPDRSASAVACNDSTCFDVSNMLRAAEIDVPATEARCSAADR